MFTHTLLTAALAVSAPNGSALEAPTVLVVPAVDEATERFNALKKELTEAQAAESAARKALQESDEWKAAREANDRDALNEMWGAIEGVDMDAYAQKFLDGAKAYEGEAGETQFLIQAYEGTRDSALASTAMEGLIARHLDKDIWEDLTLQWVMLSFKAPSRFDQFTDQIFENTKSDLVKAQVLFGKAQAIQYSLPRGEEPDEETQKEIDDLKAQVLKLAPNSIAALQIDGPRFEEERLQIGMIAPDIEGVDTSGETFKLSDYRGKVVVIDFWGHW